MVNTHLMKTRENMFGFDKYINRDIQITSRYIKMQEIERIVWIYLFLSRLVLEIDLYTNIFWWRLWQKKKTQL